MALGAGARILRPQGWFVMNRRTHVIALVAGVALAGCSSGTSNTAAVRPDRPVPSVTASTLPATPDSSLHGVFRSASFLPGLRMRLPGEGWRVSGDVFGELTLDPPGHAGALLRISKGLFPTDAGGGFLTKQVAPRAVATALLDNPDLVASGGGWVRLGGGLRATTVDIGTRPGAPAGKLYYLSYVGVGNVDAIAITRGMRVRVYTAKVHQGFGPDLLNVAVETTHPADFRAWTRLAQRALATLDLPPGIQAAG